MKVFLVSGVADGDHDLLVANDTAHGAFKHWNAYFADWDKPAQVRVYEIVMPDIPGVMMWGTLPHIEFMVDTTSMVPRDDNNM